MDLDKLDKNSIIYLDFIYFIAPVYLYQLNFNQYKLVQSSKINNFYIYTLKYKYNEYKTWKTWNYLNYS